MGCKDIGIRKSELVAKRHNSFQIFKIIKFSFISGCLILSLLPLLRTPKPGKQDPGPETTPYTDNLEELPSRKNSIQDADDDFLPPLSVLTQQRSVTYGDLVDGQPQEITFICEDGDVSQPYQKSRGTPIRISSMDIRFLTGAKSI